MWTETTRRQYRREDLRYASDMTDAEWALIEPHLPAAKRLGRPRCVPLSTDVRNWTLFDIKNWTPELIGCPEAQAERLVQVVHRRDPRAAQRPPRVWRRGAREVTVGPPGQAPGHTCAGTLGAMAGAFNKPVRRFSRSR